MNPETLVTQKIIDYCNPLPLIFVIGSTKTGKVTIARKLAKELNRDLLISDDYTERYGHDGALDALERDMNDYYYSTMPVIVEGILGFRLLRRMAKNGYHHPDLIIKTECNDETISHFYNKDGEQDKLKRAFGFNQGIWKIYSESIYLIELQGRKLKVLTLNTSIC